MNCIAMAVIRFRSQIALLICCGNECRSEKNVVSSLEKDNKNQIPNVALLLIWSENPRP
jgi:hypothetical protein